MEFKKELELLINKCNIESGSNTPDFVLANFLSNVLAAFDKAVNHREELLDKEYMGPDEI